MRYWVKIFGVNLFTGAISWWLDVSLIPTLLLALGATLYVMGDDEILPK